MAIDGATATSNPSAVVQTSAIGDWLIANQPAKDDLYKQRVEWAASAFKVVMKPNTQYSTAFPSQEIRVAELKLRLKKAIDDVTPGPTKEELDARTVAAGKQLEADMLEINARKSSRYER